ncbi:hypothetical protein FH620_31180 [Corallococcus exiguus]|nr:hypothetical protein FH620_31180 [Corallococcus exiguus]
MSPRVGGPGPRSSGAARWAARRGWSRARAPPCARGRRGPGARGVGPGRRWRGGPPCRVQATRAPGGSPRSPRWSRSPSRAPRRRTTP